MNNTFQAAFALSFATAIMATGSWAAEVGAREIAFDAPHHDRLVTGAIWYPTQDTDAPIVSLGENPVFYGSPARVDAALPEGRHPVVLLSHGLGGHVMSLRWLATALAEEGAIVVAVNHPNSTWSDFDMEAGLAHWTRAQDLSAALDWLEAHPELKHLTNSDEVSVAGFSYGGWTALSLGGVTGSLDGLIAHCEDARDTSSHCADIARAGIDLSTFNHDDWASSQRDPRVQRVAAIDPGLTFGLSAANAADVASDVSLITLGNEDTRLLATDIGPEGSGFSALLPNANAQVVAPATHFSALPVCKPAGPAILIEENDDPVCDNAPGEDRAEVHAEVIAIIIEQFGL